MEPTEDGSILQEIRTMMYAMGDCRRPLMETSRILEEALLRELRRIIDEAQVNAIRRSSRDGNNDDDDRRFFDVEDLLFVLRTDRPILRRLMTCLKVDEIKQQINRQTTAPTPSGDNDAVLSDSHRQDDQNCVQNGGSDNDEEEGMSNNCDGASGCSSNDQSTVITSDHKSTLSGTFASKRLKFCEQILLRLDPTGDLAKAVLSDDGYLAHDAVKKGRKMRAAAYAASIDTGEYMKFTEARQVSFIPFNKPSRNVTRRFLDWLFGRGKFSSEDDQICEPSHFYADFQPSPLTVDLLNLLAREYLSILIDCCLYVKKECSNMNPNLNAYGNSTSTKGLEWFRVRSAKALMIPPINLRKSTSHHHASFSGYSSYTTSSNNSSNDNKPGGGKSSNDNSSSYSSCSQPTNQNQANFFSTTNQTNEAKTTTIGGHHNSAANGVTNSLADNLNRRARLLHTSATYQQKSLGNVEDFQDCDLPNNNVVAIQPWEVREAVRRLDYYRHFHKNSRTTLNLFGCT